MLKNRKDTLVRSVKQHYKKQEIFLMESKKNVERRKTHLMKVKNKIGDQLEGKANYENKLERLEEEFTNINKATTVSIIGHRSCKQSLYLHLSISQ